MTQMSKLNYPQFNRILSKLIEICKLHQLQSRIDSLPLQDATQHMAAKPRMVSWQLVKPALLLFPLANKHMTIKVMTTVLKLETRKALITNLKTSVKAN